MAPNEIWQMDVTHIPSFGRMSFVHVCIDTYSQFMWATCQVGETAHGVISHLLEVFGPGVGAHACNPSTLGGRGWRIQVRGQLQHAHARTHSLSLSLPSEALRNFVRPGFKIKYKKIGPGV